VIVATIAFGMGIDKSNVRFVIHADLPRISKATIRRQAVQDVTGTGLLPSPFQPRDIPKIRYFIEQITDDHESAVATEKLNQTVRYASHNVCRRRQLLGYFGEDYPDDNCGACDICSGSAEQIDITTDAQIVMSAMSRTQQRFGSGHIIDIVTGADTRRIRELKHNDIKTYG